MTKIGCLQFYITIPCVFTAVHSLGSPLWDECGGLASNQEDLDYSLPRFLLALRVLMRSAFAVCMITIPTHLFQVWADQVMCCIPLSKYTVCHNIKWNSNFIELNLEITCFYMLILNYNITSALLKIREFQYLCLNIIFSLS